MCMFVGGGGGGTNLDIIFSPYSLRVHHIDLFSGLISCKNL